MNTAKDAGFAASYALTRHVTGMARGFTIDSSHGELALKPPARQHPQLQHALETIMQFRLHAAERASWAKRVRHDRQDLGFLSPQHD